MYNANAVFTACTARAGSDGDVLSPELMVGIMQAKQSNKMLHPEYACPPCIIPRSNIPQCADHETRCHENAIPM
jgi:hypothetical protein